MPELIEEWRKGLANVKYPAYDGNEVAETAAVFKDLIAQAEKLSAAAKAREAEIDAELAEPRGGQGEALHRHHGRGVREGPGAQGGG